MSVLGTDAEYAGTNPTLVRCLSTLPWHRRLHTRRSATIRPVVVHILSNGGASRMSPRESETEWITHLSVYDSRGKRIQSRGSKPHSRWFPRTHGTQPVVGGSVWS
jgi:hypothetical protein